jgi:hypothetical protein
LHSPDLALIPVIANRAGIDVPAAGPASAHTTRYALTLPFYNTADLRIRMTAIATAVSNNQETIMSLAGELAGIEERIKNLAAFYRSVLSYFLVAHH